MASLRTPAWEDNESIKFCVLDEGEEWTHSAFVKIVSATNEALEGAHERMGNVQYLCVDQWVSKEVIALLEKAAMPNLRALRIDVLLNDQTALSVSHVLRNNPQVEQLRLHLREMSEQTTVSLFDALSSLSLTALNLTFWSKLSQQSVEGLCTLLQQKRNTLVSLELSSQLALNDTALVHGLTSKGLYGLQYLQLLRFHCLVLGDIQLLQLCRAMESMPQLATLAVIAHQVSPLVKFFSTSFRPITEFEIYSTDVVPDSHISDMLNALKCNTRLQSLNVSEFRLKHVLGQGLAEEGFLTRFMDFRSNEKIESLLQRNKARHAACKRACVALIAVRQKRGVLKWIAVDVVRMIAMWLWDTRNQSSWDMEPVAEGRKKRQKKKK